MKTPHERYLNDPRFHALVDMFCAYIYRADFTPSEIREAAMLACIKYEMGRVRYRHIISPEAEEAIRVLERYATGPKDSSP